MRRAVHETMSIPCAYVAPGGGSPVAITARFHDKNRTGGDVNGQGWATIQEGVTRVIFNREELTLASVVPVKRATVTFADYTADGDDLVVKLTVQEPYDGPIEDRWQVAPA